MQLPRVRVVPGEAGYAIGYFLPFDRWIGDDAAVGAAGEDHAALHRVAELLRHDDAPLRVDSTLERP